MVTSLNIICANEATFCVSLQPLQTYPIQTIQETCETHASYLKPIQWFWPFHISCEEIYPFMSTSIIVPTYLSPLTHCNATVTLTSNVFGLSWLQPLCLFVCCPIPLHLHLNGCVYFHVSFFFFELSRHLGRWALLTTYWCMHFVCTHLCASTSIKDNLLQIQFQHDNFFT